jgi:hypothetical protein
VGYIVEKTRLLPLILILLIILLVESHFPLYKKNIRYYQNYKQYILENKSFRDYVGFFDRNAVRDYDLAAHIRSLNTQGENVYFWSDSAQMYLLTNTKPITKYIVAYHVIMNEHAAVMTEKQVEEAKPRFIVVSKDITIPSELLTGYTLKYTLERSKIYEKRS